MKLQKLLSKLEDKKVEIRGFLDNEDVVSAEKAMEEKRAIEKQIKMEKELEEEEKRSLESQKNKKQNYSVEDQEAHEFRAIVKQVMGQEITQEERAVIKTTDNAPLIPKQFLAEVEKIKKGFGSLKSYCHVIPVNRMEGSKPVVDMNQNALQEIAEGSNIVEGSLASTDITFKCVKVGLMDILSSETVDDAAVEIETLVKENFAEIATVNENIKIINILKANASVVDSVTDYKGIAEEMDKMVPAARNGLVLITNEDGFAHLKNLQDAQKRPLNLVTEMNGKYYFNGKELVVVDKTILAPDTGTQIFIIANMREAVKFFDRKAVTIEKWRDPKNDTENISILERFDVKKGGTTRSLKKIEIA